MNEETKKCIVPAIMEADCQLQRWGRPNMCGLPIKKGDMVLLSTEVPNRGKPRRLIVEGKNYKADGGPRFAVCDPAARKLQLKVAVHALSIRRG